MKKVKSTDKVDEKTVQFVKDHIERKLVMAGFTPEKACDLIACCSDQEISELLPARATKVGALGDGKFLKWIADHKEGILSAIEKGFKLLSLLGLIAAKAPKAEEEEDSEEESEEDEESEDEEDDEEDEKPTRRR